jgi:hypothetical protein
VQHVSEGANNPVCITFDGRSECIDARLESVFGDRLDGGDNGWTKRTLDKGFDHELRAIPGHRHSRVAVTAL